MTGLPRALLVDLDDTVIAFSASAEPCWREVCERHTAGLDGLGADELFAAIRASAGRFWADPSSDDRGRLDLEGARREIVGDALEALESFRESLAHAIADEYSALREKRVTLFPGARSALELLRRAGVRLAMVTNGSTASQRPKIARFGLEPLFDSIHIEEETGAGKPDPLIFQAALDAVQVGAAEAWMIGDNLERDVAGAQRIGIHGIWCDYAGVGLPSATHVRPDRIVQSLAELLA